jgi:hypothetical protein
MHIDMSEASEASQDELTYPENRPLEDGGASRERTGRSSFLIKVPSLGIDPDEYTSFPEETRVRKITAEIERGGELYYKTTFEDGRIDMVSFHKELGFRRQMLMIFLGSSGHTHGLR